MQPGEKIGRYTVDRLLGRGGMAEVLLAHTEGPGGFEKQVVIKRILPFRAEDPRYVSMFLDEARVEAKFQHPNLVQVFELEHIQDQYFIVMEYIEGVDLGQLVRACSTRDHEVPFDIAAHFVAEAAEGLHYAHELRNPAGEPLNLVHRDVSPANIIVTRTGSVKVVDFGIAKHEESSQNTEAGALKGKITYMSPEQTQGEKLDRRSDIFSLGAVLYELCTAVQCFKRFSTIETMEAIVNVSFVPITSYRPSFPPALGAILDRMLAKDREQRFDSAAEASQALRGFLDETHVPTSAEVRDFLRGVAVSHSTEDSRAYTALSHIHELAGPQETTHSSLGGDAAAGPQEATHSELHVDPAAAREEPTAVKTRLISEETIREPLPRGVLPPASSSNLEQTRRERRGQQALASPSSGGGEPAAVVDPSQRASTGPVLTLPALGEKGSAADGPEETHRFPIPSSGAGLRPALVATVALGLLLVLVGLWLFLGSGEPAESIGADAGASALALAGGDERVDAGEAALPAPPPAPDRGGDANQRRPDPSEPPPPIPRDAGAAGADAAKSTGATQPDRVEKPPRTVARRGRLSVSSNLATSVSVDGRPVGKTPIRGLLLRAGPHRVKLSSKTNGASKTLRVDVPAGGHVRRQLSFGKGRVVLNASPWAEVYLRGEKLGVTPLQPIELYEGLHNFTLKNSDRGVVKQVRIKVVAGQLTKRLVVM